MEDEFTWEPVYNNEEFKLSIAPIEETTEDQVNEEEIPAIKSETTAENISEEKNDVVEKEVVAKSGNENENLTDSRKEEEEGAAKSEEPTDDEDKPKRLQTNWDIKTKIEALDKLEVSETQAQVSKDMGIPESTLRGWKNNSENIREKYRIEEETKQQQHPPQDSQAT